MNHHHSIKLPVNTNQRTPRRSHAATTERLREAASSPEIDAAKFRELFLHEERQAALYALIEFNRAFGQLQRELPVITERGVLTFTNEGRGSTYALWEDINETVKPYLTKHGFSLRFRTGQDGGHVSVTCILSHTRGHSEETTVRLPLDLSDGKSSVHAVGSSTSYAKRYAASALLNITTAGEDDDGMAASRPPCIDPEQLAELRLLLASVDGDETKFAALLRIPSLAELPIGRFRHAVSTLRAKGVRK